MSALAENLRHARRLFSHRRPDGPMEPRESLFADKVLAEIEALAPGMDLMQCPAGECCGRPCGCLFLIHRDQDGTCPNCGTVFYAPAM